MSINKYSHAARGSALLETAIMLPLLFLLFLNAANFGTYIYAWITVNNAARAAAEFQVYNGVVVGFPQLPSFSTVCLNVWQTDVSSLPSVGAKTGDCGWGNVTLEICSNDNGSISCSISGSGSAPALTIPADPEPDKHILYLAQVAYDYTPIFPVFTLPVIDLPLSLSPATLTRQVVMRSMQ